MTFAGWAAEAMEFYEGLEVDNTKAYWTAHKPVYDAQVLAPMNALITELADEFGEGKIFRPYRDVRFSHDKSPYKTAIGTLFGKGGYVQLSADGLAAGAGYYKMAPDQLARYRAVVADDATGPGLQRLLAKLAKAGVTVTGRDQLLTMPRGYTKDHPRAELLRNKALVAWQDWPPAEWLHTAEAKDRVAEFLRAAAPLSTWLDKHVGPTTITRER